MKAGHQYKAGPVNFTDLTNSRNLQIILWKDNCMLVRNKDCLGSSPRIIILFFLFIIYALREIYTFLYGVGRLYAHSIIFILICMEVNLVSANRENRKKPIM